MDIKKFALGLRFDPIETEDIIAERENALSALTGCIAPELIEGWYAYGGHYKLDENDDKRIFTLILMGGKLKPAKKLYNAVRSNNYLISMLTSNRPIIQSNPIFRIEGFEYYGQFGIDSELSGGEVTVNFKPITKELVEKAPKTRFTAAIAPDKYKGTLDQFEACSIMKSAARKTIPGTCFIDIPVADGGDGTIAVLAKKLGGRYKTVAVTGPDREKIEASYAIVNRDTAIIECASASGLALIHGEPDALNATSRGTGELIKDALEKHIKKIYIALGGSATNDGGMGAAAALGVRFLDGEGNELDGCGANMAKVRSIDLNSAEPKLKDIEITVLCDVRNPMTGENGATYTFGPQKGAAGQALDELERGMLNLEKLYNDIAGKEASAFEGAGAAGGMGAMFTALFGAKLEKGAETVMQLIDFDRSVSDADLIITGEGRFDKTSSAGKATGEVIKHGKAAGIPVYVLAGSIGDGCGPVEKAGEARLFACIEGTDPIPYSKEKAREKLRIAAEKLFAEVKAKLGL